VLGAAVLALSMTACSSGTTPVAGKSSGTGSVAASTTTSSADQSTPASGSPASASSSAGVSDSDTASASSTATPPAVTNKKSDFVERSGFRFKVDIVTYPYLPPAGAFLQPAANQEFLKLHIELANIAGNGNGTFSMMDLEVRDSANEEILPDVVASDDLPKDAQLGMVDLKPGEKQTGEVVFIAPKGAKGLRLVLKGTLMTRDGSGVTTGPPPVIDLGV
jgi:hypothetical protein